MRVRYPQYLSVAASAACLCVLAQDLVLRHAADALLVTAPRLHFLTGKPLERMRNGASVTYDMQLSILSENRQYVLRRGFERFVVSYDLWEEKFSATRMRTTRTSASHLTAEAAESWCLDHLSVPSSGLATEKPVYVRLDIRAQEPKDRRSIEDDASISLGRLIEIFSRAGNPASGTQWRAEAGPISLQKILQQNSKP
jgi:hypothetical protein